MAYLLDFLFPPRTDEALLRAAGPDALSALLAPRLIPLDRSPAAALLPFDEPLVRAAIHEAKYHGNNQAFASLSGALADFLPEYLADSEYAYTSRTPVFLAPVPLGRVRRAERGYNQAEEVARRAGQVLGIPAETSLLVRVRETPSQVSLAREAREENMRNAFAGTPLLATRLNELPNARYIILDDVITTGATLGACVDTLIQMGVAAERILPIALAH